MRKSTLFISTALTIFMLVVMAEAVTAYQQTLKTNDAKIVDQTTPGAEIQPAGMAGSVPTLPAVISPEQATSIAVEFTGDSGVYGVEVVEYEGVPAFLVTFSSGKLVYISSTGEILAVSEVAPVVIEAQAPQKHKNNNTTNGSGGGEPESHDDNHEDHPDN